MAVTEDCIIKYGGVKLHMIIIIIITIIIIIIRTTKFLEKFISSERNAVTGINQI